MAAKTKPKNPISRPRPGRPGKYARIPADLKPTTRKLAAYDFERVQCKARSKFRSRLLLIERLDFAKIPHPPVEDPDFNYVAVRKLCAANDIDIDMDRLTYQELMMVRCKNRAIMGGVLCQNHGGLLTPNIEAARQRLLTLISPAMERAHTIITKGRSESAAVAMINSVLDRAGVVKNPIHPDSGGGLLDSNINLSTEQLSKVFNEEQLETFLGLMRMLEDAIKSGLIDVSSPNKMVSGMVREDQDDNDESEGSTGSVLIPDELLMEPSTEEKMFKNPNTKTAELGYQLPQHLKQLITPPPGRR